MNERLKLTEIPSSLKDLTPQALEKKTTHFL